MLRLYINERKAICDKCPIYSHMKDLCNPSLWINPTTDEVSTVKRPGYVQGCGCHCSIKMKNYSSHCVAGKW